MIWIYALATVFGAIFVVPMVLGGLDIDTDIDIDLDAEADFDLDGFEGADMESGFDFDGETDGGFLDSLGDIAGSLISFRSIVLFIAFFGVSGLVFSALGVGSAATAAGAIVLGGFAAALNSVLFTIIGRNEVNSQLTNRDLEGTLARVVLPIDADRKGRIRAELDHQPHYLVALPAALEADQTFAVGDAVVVVEIERGTARVARIDLDAQPLSPALDP